MKDAVKSRGMWNKTIQQSLSQMTFKKKTFISYLNIYMECKWHISRLNRFPK